MQALDTIVFETSLVRAARFRVDARDPRFRDSGPAANFAVCFPRTAVWIRYSGSRSFVADPSLATIYNPGQEYTRDSISSDGDRCEWFAVSQGVAVDIATSLDKKSFDRADRPFRHAAAPVDQRLYLAQRALFTRLEKGAIGMLEAEETIISLVTAVLASAGERKSRRSFHDEARVDLVERAKASLSRNLTTKQGLSGLALALGVSPFHLCRVFHEQTAQTLHAFKTDLRLRKALELLGERIDLSRIALECGFSSHSHFTSSMRARFGKTPSALRAALKA